ncbi:MAG: hypothetical protein Q4C52_13550 [Eubacteriales bacterium]|nr:hypothetical protein [Eubacteriales bacterium]
MDIYDSINQYTPSIGYLIFGVEDDFLHGGIDSFDNMKVGARLIMELAED